MPTRYYRSIGSLGLAHRLKWPGSRRRSSRPGRLPESVRHPVDADWRSPDYLVAHSGWVAVFVPVPWLVLHSQPRCLLFYLPVLFTCSFVLFVPLLIHELTMPMSFMD
jgi:hypothetical protein